jgi:multidrug efflux pump subunit AcrB
MVQRKLAANVEVSTSSLWVLAIPLALAFWLYLRRSQGRPFDRLTAAFTTLPAGLWAALVAAVLGSALNDSGAIIGGVMAMVVATSLAVLLVDAADVEAPVRADGVGPR